MKPAKSDPSQGLPSPVASMPCLVMLMTTIVSAIMLVRWGMHPNFGYDEAWHAAIAYLRPLWISLQTASADTHPFLYYLFLRPLYLFDQHPFALRLLSIVPSLLTLPLLFLLLRRLRVNTAIALVTVVVLAISFSFNAMGIVVRSYALTALLLLGALWFWIAMLPGAPGRPSRVAAVSSLALFTIAFWCLYAAAFATTALIGTTLFIMLLDGQFRRDTWNNWRRYSGWPEWTLFFGLHGAGIAWFMFGRFNEKALGFAPGHVVKWLAAEGQEPIAYLSAGLRQQAALFTPLMDLPDTVIDVGLLFLLGLIVTLAVIFVRRRHFPLAILALTPLLLTIILALLGLFGVFPFGGELRHQYVLFPFLLLLLPLGLQLMWPRLTGRWPRRIAIAVVIGIALNTSYRTHQTHFYIGEPSPLRWWDEETRVLFSEASEVPVLVPRSAFYTMLANLLRPGSRYLSSWACDNGTCVDAPQGLVAIFKDWPAFQQHRVWLGKGATTDLFKSRDWLIGVLPDEHFFARLRALLEASGIDAMRILSPASPGVAVDEAKLRAQAAHKGFRLDSFQRTEQALIWQVTKRDVLSPPDARSSDTPPSADPSAAGA